MEIIKNFGFDPILFVAQIINFLIVLYILKRFLFKPMLAALKKRQEEVRLGLQQAEKSRKLLEQAELREKTILKNAQQQADKMLAGAKKEAQDAAKKIEENAKDRAEKMIVQAQQKIEEQTEKMEKRVERHVSELAIALLQKSLQDFFVEKEQKQIMQRALKQLKKAD